MITVAHKNPDEISNETFITWISKSLKQVEKETIINGWNPLVNGLQQEEEFSNIADIDSNDEGNVDTEGLLNELLGESSPEEKEEITVEMLRYEIISDDDITIKIQL